MTPPNDNILRTVADELLELVKESNKISLDEAAKKLKIPIATMEALVDFLVEEKIFGIEYKFTTPYIYLYKEGIKEIKGKEKFFTKKTLSREQFYRQAKEKNVPYENIEGTWKNYIRQNMGYIREEFMKKARERNIPEEKIEELWRRYLDYM